MVPAGVARPVPRRIVVALSLGTLLNPLNSSMISVALLRLRGDFDVSVGAVSWVISGFYLSAAVGQPLMGRIADEFGARRLFCLGLTLVCVTGVLAPLSPSFGSLVAARVVQAAGTSAAFPSALIVIRAATGQPRGRPPAGAMGALAVAASVSASLGPVLGGLLVSFAGWQAVFLVNVPVSLLGLIAAYRWIPPDPPRATVPSVPSGTDTGTATGTATRARASVDLPGVLLFTAALAGLLGFLLSVPDGPLWVLLPVAPIAAALLAVHELRTEEPFLDLRMLAANRPLLGVYGQFAAINTAFYGAFYGLPLWFEQDRGMSPREAGLLLLPVAGMGLISTPVAVRLVRRFGPRPPLVVGSAVLTAGSLLLLGFRDATPALVIVLVCVVLGVPNGLNNLGLQAAMYEVTPSERTGAAAGLYQTARYVGAILSTSVIGLVFGHAVTTSGLHVIATVMTVISALLVVASVMTRRSPHGETRR